MSGGLAYWGMAGPALIGSKRVVDAVKHGAGPVGVCVDDPLPLKVDCSQFGNKVVQCDMQVHGLDKLNEFCSKHPPARSWVRSWLADTRGSAWATPQDVKYKYPRASILSNNMVIFDVKGNDYRMLAQIAYKIGIVVVKWIGTHDAYDKITWESSLNEARGRQN